MQCLQCTNESAPGKALCDACYSDKHQAHKINLELWEKKEQEARPSPSPVVVDNTTTEAVLVDAKEVRQGPTPVGHLIRFLAFLCDYSALFVLSTLLGNAAVHLMDISTEALQALMGATDPASKAVLLSLIRQILLVKMIATLPLYWLFYVCFECSSLMGTPGKFLLGLVVRTERGERLDPFTSSVRFLVRSSSLWSTLFIPALISGALTGRTLLMAGIAIGASFLLSIVDPALVFFNAARHTLHDFAASTYVVESRASNPVSIGVAIATIFLAAIFGLFV